MRNSFVNGAVVNPNNTALDPEIVISGYTKDPDASRTTCTSGAVLFKLCDIVNAVAVPLPNSAVYLPPHDPVIPAVTLREPVIFAFPLTDNCALGVVVLIPMLLEDWKILELEIVEDALNNAKLFTVPGPTVPAPPGAQEALIANDELTARLELIANDAVVGVKVIDVAAEAVVANDAVVANELLIALFAQLLVPNSEPVIPRDTFNEPVSCVLPDTISPFRATNSFAIRYPK